MSFPTHPCVHAFITHILCISGIEMALVWLIRYTFSYTLFKSAICFLPLMNLCETWHLNETRYSDGVADDHVAILLPLWRHATSLWRHADWICSVSSHNAWMGYAYSLPNLIAQGLFTNTPPHPTPHPTPNNGACVIICESTSIANNSAGYRSSYFLWGNSVTGGMITIDFITIRIKRDCGINGYR